MTRIATVSYLNARPLTSRLDRSRFEILEGHPSEIADLLRRGEVDVALVPVAAALSDGDYRLLGEHCIGADGPVASVLLVAETPPEAWTEVVLDGVSRTSVTLARLILAEGPLAARVRADLVVRDGAKGEGLRAAGGTVAGLVIGDAARAVPERLTERIDLAAAWKAWTGLPFVFAVWAGRPDLPADVRRHLVEAGRAGLAARAADFSGDDLVYVTENLRYAFDERAQVGLRRYAAMAARHGWIAANEPVFYDPPRRSLPRPDLDATLVRAADGEPLSADEVRALFTYANLADLGAAARARAEAAGADRAVPWTPARRIVVTDVDVDGALGWRRPGEPDATLLTPDEVHARVAEAADVAAGEIHLVGGRHPGLGLAAWVRFVEAARAASDADVYALDLDGLRHLAAVDDAPIERIVDALRGAGLSGLTGGPELVLDDTIRAKIAPGGLTARGWRGLAQVVAARGLPLVAGLEYGAGESDAQRLAHLLALADLHAATGAFVGFRVAPLRAGRGVDPVGASAHDHVRLTAIARIVLGDVTSHEAPWLHEAPGVAQAALHAGANSLGPVFLPVRADQDDNPYVNPRATVGARKQVDPWEVFCAEVAWHLERAGFVSDRQGPRRVVANRVADPPVQPSV